MKKVTLFALCFSLILVWGCSRSGDVGITIQITSTDDLDGYVMKIGNSATPMADRQWAIMVGDSFENGGYRGFVSFDLSAIASTIKSARLRLYQTDFVEGDPYGDLSFIVVDHVYTGGTLDAADYDGGTITSNIGTFSSDEEETWRELDVSEAVQRDVSEGRDDSQFRLRFLQETDNDDRDDTVIFEDRENNRDTGNQPTLIVVYE